jgi:hypothetical protein
VVSIRLFHGMMSDHRKGYCTGCSHLPPRRKRETKSHAKGTRSSVNQDAHAFGAGNWRGTTPQFASFATHRGHALGHHLDRLCQSPQPIQGSQRPAKPFLSLFHMKHTPWDPRGIKIEANKIRGAGSLGSGRKWRNGTGGTVRISQANEHGSLSPLTLANYDSHHGGLVLHVPGCRACVVLAFSAEKHFGNQRFPKPTFQTKNNLEGDLGWS